MVGRCGVVSMMWLVAERIYGVKLCCGWCGMVWRVLHGVDGVVWRGRCGYVWRGLSVVCGCVLLCGEYVVVKSMCSGVRVKGEEGVERDVVWRVWGGVDWYGVVWRVWGGVDWYGVVWCGGCGVVWIGMVGCGVVWGGVDWYDVVWCGVEGVGWCGLVWCDVVWRVWGGVVWCGEED
jgi:hypothetical protein